MTALDAFLNDLEAKARAATPGPWAWDDINNAFESKSEMVADEDMHGRIMLPALIDFRAYHRPEQNRAFVLACDPATLRLLVAVARAAKDCLLAGVDKDDRIYFTIRPNPIIETLARLEAHARGDR